MPEIPHTQLEKHLGEAAPPCPVYLVFGEEYFYKTVFDRLVSAIIPENQRDFNLEVLEGNEENIFEALERVNTFSLDTSAKVVGFCDSDIFYAKQDAGKLVHKIKTALTDGNMDKAAAAFQKLLAMLDIDPEHIGETEKEVLLQADPEAAGDDTDWLETIREYRRSDRTAAAVGPDGRESLRKAIEKGFAPGNHLVITTDLVDKRRKLFQTIKEQGVVIDCSVAAGNTQADKKSRARALAEIRKTFEAESGKTIADQAFQMLQEMTGFAPRVVANSLEKLRQYTGERTAITPADVQAVLQRTKTDPIYELTNAIADRNTGQALFFMQNLLSGSDPAHPLQILAAVSNKIRGLLLIKTFTNSSYGQSWHPDIRFERFKQIVLPEIEKYDAEILREIELRDKPFREETTTGKKKKKKRSPTEMTIAPNPRNLYPTYKNFEKAANFAETELLGFFDDLKTADIQLKSSGKNQRLILENLLLTICRQHQ